MKFTEYDIVLICRMIVPRIRLLERHLKVLNGRIRFTDLETWQPELEQTKAEIEALEDLKSRIVHDMLRRNVLAKLAEEVYNLDDQ